jgi:flagellar assembly protein FliH
MRSARPYRFPPLAQLHQLQGEGATVSGKAALQEAIADGFRQGQVRGYEEGHASGLQAGADEARATARTQGLEQGLREARERFAGLAAPLEALFGALKSAQEDFESAQRKEVVELVARVARQVIRVELTLQPTQLLALVDETLASMPPARDGIEVHLNPEDLQRIQELAPDRVQAWTLLPDVRLETGECRVHAGGREADAGCRQRLAACMKQIKGQLIPGADDVGELRPPELEIADDDIHVAAPVAPAPVAVPARPRAAAAAKPAAKTKTAAAPAPTSAAKPRARAAKEISA